MYRLNDLTPAEIKARVEELLKDHRYIFPVDPITVIRAHYDESVMDCC